GADVTDPGTETEESLGASDSTQRPADSQTPSCKIQETLSSAHTYIHLKLSKCAH
ncbi:translocated promoter region b, nuclear basket protein, partial [Lates japonicus]